MRDGTHRGRTVLAVDIDEVADVAEGVERAGRFGQRLDVEAEIEQPLPVILAGLQSQQHDAPAHRLPVVEGGKMLDLEPTLSRHAHWLGESSTA